MAAQLNPKESSVYSNSLNISVKNKLRFLNSLLHLWRGKREEGVEGKREGEKQRTAETDSRSKREREEREMLTQTKDGREATSPCN